MLTAIFDGNCVICNTTRRIVSVLDWFNRVEFVDLHNTDLMAERFPNISETEAMGQIHVVDDHDMTVFAGFQATRRMTRAVPALVPLYLILRLPVIGNWVGPRVYRFIAKHRYAINRLLGVDLEQQQTEEAACEGNICKIP
jgi:predicted DCC family thiol-disulfide oxidoreductase YuxK